jgi:putative glutamine amidotransferase
VSRRTFLVATGAEEYAANYVAALQAVGVPADDIQVVTPAGLAEAGIAHPGRELVPGAAGLVLCGGIDVDPARYGEAVLPDGDVEIDPLRDAMEWDLLAAARAARLPVWGVCRGIQVLNVFLGGSLWQDLPSQCPAGVEHSVVDPLDCLVHDVRVLEAATSLGGILSRERPLVNSRHHQAVKRLAPGLVPVAESPDGLVEAAALAGPEGERWWVRGVQWHPENLVAMAQHRALWDDFVRAAGSAPGLANPERS